MKDRLPLALLRGPRVIAVFEIIKGALVLIVGLGMLSLLQQDAQAAAEEIVRRLHLNPARHYPKIFIDAASDLESSHLWFLAGASVIYAAVRFVEGFGLWHGFKWAEWFAVLSSSLYLPVEVYELSTGVTPVKLGIFLVNLVIVLYLIHCLYLQRGFRTD